MGYEDRFRPVELEPAESASEFQGKERSPDSAAPSSSVDLERREDRFIIFVRDTPELMEAMSRFTRELRFPETPVTRTVYFGDSARGLPRGLSIKARVYERERLPGRWDLTPESMFELLELKRTVAAPPRGAAPEEVPAKKKGKKGRDQMVEILRLSGSLLDRDTYKEKKRKPKITLGELLGIIGDPPGVRERLDPSLYVHLLETVHPLSGYRWIPLIGTEYERTHFVTRDESYAGIFRATLDKRVTHYAFERSNGAFIGVPVGIEDFSRFEVKADHERLAGTELGDWLEEILVRFRAFRIPSKKYRGLTLRSSYQIRREGLRDEVPGRRLYSLFPSRPVRYRDHEHYVNLARYLQSSKTFHLYHDEPTLLEHHEHFVRGRQKGLEVTISGSELEYEREPELVCQKPVPVYRVDRTPVTSLPLTSRDDLERAGIAKIKGREPRYVRSRGFLVENRKTGRVYRVGLERRMGASSEPQYYVIVEYAGRARGRPLFSEEPIVKDIVQLSRFLRRDPLLKPA